ARESRHDRDRPDAGQGDVARRGAGDAGEAVRPQSAGRRPGAADGYRDPGCGRRLRELWPIGAAESRSDSTAKGSEVVKSSRGLAVEHEFTHELTASQLHGLTSSYPRISPPVTRLTSATIFLATASISGSVRVCSRGCSVTSMATDFLPGPRLGPAKTSNTETSAISVFSAPVAARTTSPAGTDSSSRKAK